MNKLKTFDAFTKITMGKPTASRQPVTKTPVPEYYMGVEVIP